MKKILFSLLVCLITISLFSFSNAKAVNSDTLQYSDSTTALYQQIMKLDSILFDAFNNRKLSVFENMFAKDLEFYHDKGGLTSYDFTINSLKKLAADKQNDLHRKLIDGQSEVYPIKDFGAIQIGSHRFCHTENKQQDCGTFKFVHIWKQIGNEWKIVRVVSYDH